MTRKNARRRQMNKLGQLLLIVAIAFAISACGDKKDSAARDQEAQRAIQEGMQKERKMYEGMQKGVESVEKKTQEQRTK
jgi:uncharacterized lipoprotein YehR (DUF1307 family)